MKALVAGGAGFIGSHLCDRLLADGHTVVCVDNLMRGTRENIRQCMAHPSFTFVQADFAGARAVDEVFDAYALDTVFHLIANSDIQASALAPGVELDNTLLPTFHLLEAMRTHGVKRLFFASTSAVYGDQQRRKVAETGTELTPVSYYGAAKLSGEALIHAFSYMNGLSALVFRFPNVIGSRLTHGVIYDFIARLRQNPQALHILGDGLQQKPYLHVSDLVDAIVRCMAHTPTGVTLYNVGVQSTTTVSRIADIVCAGMGLHGVRYTYSGGASGWKGDVPFFAYDLSKVHATGWQASMTSDEAVERTVAEELR